MTQKSLNNLISFTRCVLSNIKMLETIRLFPLWSTILTSSNCVRLVLWQSFKVKNLVPESCNIWFLHYFHHYFQATSGDRLKKSCKEAKTTKCKVCLCTEYTGCCHNVLIQGSVVVIRQFLIFINQTFLMVSVALVTMVDWKVPLFSCLGPLLGPLGGPKGALEAPKMPKITISCFDYRNAHKWVEQGPKIGWTLQNTFRGVC